MAKSVGTQPEWPISSEWRKESRRLGGGMMAGSALAGLGWVSATQSFVTLDNGELAHPSFWQWPAWICVAGLVAGSYLWLATYLDALPMFGRERTVDHSSLYSLALKDMRVEVSPPDASGLLGCRIGVLLLNGGPSIIEYTRESMDVTIAGVTNPNPSFITDSGRLLPKQEKLYRYPFITNIPDAPVIEAEVGYVFEYGPPSGHPRYRRHHRVRVTISTYSLTAGPTEPRLVDWMDLEPETDEIVTP